MSVRRPSDVPAAPDRRVRTPEQAKRRSDAEAIVSAANTQVPFAGGDAAARIAAARETLQPLWAMLDDHPDAADDDWIRPEDGITFGIIRRVRAILSE
jgi:hypothetical protein